MLTRLAVDNFRCLKNVDVPLKPLTVLVGPNDSGKSSFLDVLTHLNQPNFELEISDHWLSDPRNTVTATVNGSIDLRRNEPNRRRYHWTEQRLQQSLLPIECLRLPAFGLTMRGPGIPDDVEIEAVRMESDGSNVAGLLDVMLRLHPDRFNQVIERFRTLIPGCQRLTIRHPSAAERQVNVLLESGLELPADQMSSGVRMMLFFLTLAFRPGAPRTILLEEPENGIHPKRLSEVMDLLRGLVEGRLGEVVQVIVTTHSPYLLDHVHVENDQIIVFRRAPDGSRTAEPVDTERLKPFLDEFMLGEVWFNETEEGLVAKP